MKVKNQEKIMAAVKAVIDAEDKFRAVCGSEDATVEARQEVQAALVRTRAALRDEFGRVNRDEYGS